MGLDHSVNYDEKAPPLGAAFIMKQAIQQRKKVLELAKLNIDSNSKKLAFQISDMIVQHHKQKSQADDEHVTFQSIVNEVNALKSSIAHKGLVESPTGIFVEL